MARHGSRPLAAVAGGAAGVLAALPAGLCTGACSSCLACTGVVGVVLVGGVLRLSRALATRSGSENPVTRQPTTTQPGRSS